MQNQTQQELSAMRADLASAVTSADLQNLVSSWLLIDECGEDDETMRRHLQAHINEFAAQTAEVWLVIDTHTKAIVGSCKTLRQASRSCDRRDLTYGAIRYTYRRAGA